MAKAYTSYTLQEVWEFFLRAIKRKDVDSMIAWREEFIAKGGWAHAADGALMTDGRSAPAKAPRK